MTRYFEQAYDSPYGDPNARERESRPRSTMNMRAIGEHVFGDSYKSANVGTTYYPEHESPNVYDWQLDDEQDYTDQPQLFQHQPQTIKITEAYAHPSLVHTIPIMLSHIHKTLGAQFEPMELLSEHSTNLYHKARKLGLPVRAPEWAGDDEGVTASFDFGDEYDSDYMESPMPPKHRWTDWNELTPEQVKQAREHYKTLRKQPKTYGKLSPQFEQLKFDV